MIYYEGPGKTCAVAPQDRLSLVFKEVQENYALQKASTRLTNLKLSMLCDFKKPHAAYPTLDTKGGEGKHLALCFLPVVKKAFAKSAEAHEIKKSAEAHEIKMVEALEAVTCLVALWDDAGLFLKKKEFETSVLLAEKFLNSYEHLHKWALAKGRKLFNIVHKHHSFLHLAQSSQLLNPRITTTSRGEDFVGHISKWATQFPLVSEPPSYPKNWHQSTKCFVTYSKQEQILNCIAAKSWIDLAKGIQK